MAGPAGKYFATIEPFYTAFYINHGNILDLWIAAYNYIASLKQQIRLTCGPNKAYENLF